MIKNLPVMQETWVQSLGWEDPWRKERLPTPIFWPREFHGQRSLAGYSPWGLRVRHDWATFTEHTTVYKMDNQWILYIYTYIHTYIYIYIYIYITSIKHRELYSIFCNNLYGKRICKRMNMCVNKLPCCTYKANTTL